MRAAQRYLAVVSLLVAIGMGSALASVGDDTNRGHQPQRSAHRSFLQRILDYLDSRISLPPG